MLDIKPVLKDGYVQDSWYKLGTRGQEHVTGEIWLQTTYHVIRVSSVSVCFSNMRSSVYTL